MKNGNITILGLQWGDEGKGKVVDYFAGEVDIVARFGGGANAGHTVISGQDKFILHLLPSGIIHPDTTCYLGGGMVCDPAGLFEELDELHKQGISCQGRLFIDNNTHLVLPQHKALEKYSEDLNKASSIDTTLKGIGPAYADKADRIGIIAGDLLDENILSQRVANFIEKKKLRLAAIEHETLRNPQNLLNYLKTYAARLKNIITDVTFELKKAMSENKRILFEGAQGSLLDICLGTYPYVTSSNTSIGGLFSGLGLPPGLQGEVLGVVKAYTTRVGNGPFPTELDNAVGESLRQKGGEFGATTGRPRRTGWLDLALIRRTAFMSGVSALVITKLDVLDDFENINICTAHKHGDRIYEFPSLFGSFLEKAEPVYQTLKGWRNPTAGITAYEKLPDEAKNYLQFIEKEVGVPVKFVSTGSDRKAFLKIS